MPTSLCLVASSFLPIGAQRLVSSPNPAARLHRHLLMIPSLLYFSPCAKPQRLYNAATFLRDLIVVSPPLCTNGSLTPWETTPMQLLSTNSSNDHDAIDNELVRSGVYFNMGFKEQQMKKVATDVLAFAGVHVTTLQLYNHIRNWRTKWSVIMKMKSDRILDWSEDGCCYYSGDEGTADEYIQVRSLIQFLHRSKSIYMSMSFALTVVPCGLHSYPKHRQYVGTPITNYAQMKTIFTPRFVCKARLFQPNLLVRVIDFIADNEAEYVVYRKLQPSERRSWLRTWLRNQFPA
ncbi:hypothetical protein QYE76_034121 [Lolium multiflorum]|uniref:Uncharacterized protein n=1 Tax=Lolium multiflorum TaxID=4521 RepID=A0AAD8QWR5_LOLMU|nr:hypothetical protein QYE76_034121 [Lolium multiflorum]